MKTQVKKSHEPFRWSAEVAQSVTQGTWYVAPPEGWHARAICAVKGTFVPGDLLLAATEGFKGGLSPQQVRELVPQAAGIITREPERWNDLGVPLLQVNIPLKALLALAKKARDAFHGKVISVTGSCGKTTTIALLAHVLRTAGSVGHTRGSFNSLYGVAWNIASMAQEASWWIVEHAVSQKMSQSACLARPDAAIILNVAPAHLAYWNNVETIALQKSRLFEGMQPGSRAVAYRDMDQFPIIAASAVDTRIDLLTYGRNPRARFRLLSLDEASFQFSWAGKTYTVPLPGVGEHMALNILAAMGALTALDIPFEDFLEHFATFAPVKGRGNLHNLIVNGHPATVVNQSYNANPASMRAALASFPRQAREPASRLVILGDMLELGADSAQLHRDLAAAVRAVEPDRVLLCGPEMHALWESLEGDCVGAWYADTDALHKEVNAWIRPHDVILVKGSHDTGLWRLVRQLVVESRAQQKPTSA